MAKEAAKAHEAYISINKHTGAMQLTVPQGTKLVDAIRSLSKIDLSALAKLPRGCQNCISGHPFDIREQFDPVINVSLGEGH
jgi:hypothetical protein